jgi:hypothetical protein
MFVWKLLAWSVFAAALVATEYFLIKWCLLSPPRPRRKNDHCR